MKNKLIKELKEIREKEGNIYVYSEIEYKDVDNIVFACGCNDDPCVQTWGGSLAEYEFDREYHDKVTIDELLQFVNSLSDDYSLDYYTEYNHKSSFGFNDCMGTCNHCDHYDDCNKVKEATPSNGTSIYLFLESNIYSTDDRICFNCRDFYSQRGYVCGQVDNLFHSQILSHGVSTGFSGRTDKKELIRRLLWLDENRGNSDSMICCSHKSQCIGSIGVFVKGYNEYVSNIDLFSKTNKFGHKVFDKELWRAQEGLISCPSQIDLSKWDHTEHIVSQYSIVGLWVKDWALQNDPAVKDIYNILKDTMKVFIVKGRKS